MKRLLTAIAAVCASVTVLAGCGGSDGGGQAAAPGTAAAFDQALFDSLPRSVKDSRTIRFGALWETPPFIGVEPGDSSKPVGLTPDLAAAVSEVLGVTPQWQNMQWPAQLPGLQAGNVDALWGQITDTQERERTVADIVAVSRSPLALLVPQDNPKGIKRLADACGLRVAVPNGAQQTAAVEGVSGTACTAAGKPAIVAVPYPGAQQAIVALKGGSVDAWFDSAAPVKETAESGGFAAVVLDDAEVGRYMNTINGIAVAKNQPELSNALAAALRKLAESGRYQEIMQKWGLGDGLLGTADLKVNTFSGLPAGATA